MPLKGQKKRDYERLRQRKVRALDREKVKKLNLLAGKTTITNTNKIKKIDTNDDSRVMLRSILIKHGASLDLAVRKVLKLLDATRLHGTGDNATEIADNSAQVAALAQLIELQERALMAPMKNKSVEGVSNIIVEVLLMPRSTPKIIDVESTT